MGFPSGSDGKECASNAGDLGSIPGLGRSPGEENGYPLQYSCLKNPMGCSPWGRKQTWLSITHHHQGKKWPGPSSWPADSRCSLRGNISFLLEEASLDGRKKKTKNSCYRQGRWNCFLTQWSVNGRAPQVALVVKNSPANARDIRNLGSIPWSGRSPRKGSGNPLQYSYLESPMDRGVWWTVVHGVTKGRTRLKQLHTHGFLRDWKVGNLWFLFNSYYNLSFEAVKVRDFCCIPVIENWGILVSDSLKIKLWGWFSKL